VAAAPVERGIVCVREPFALRPMKGRSKLILIRSLFQSWSCRNGGSGASEPCNL
jgi:hypothetical protein